MTSIYRRRGLPTLMGSRFDISIRCSTNRARPYQGECEDDVFLRCQAELDGADTETSITEIAYRWGFNDSAHFSRLFKASFGMSPTQYRSSRRLGASDK